MDPITIAVGVISFIAGVGVTYEITNRQTSSKSQGQNDITEADCVKLCEQLRTRWNELCLALSDEAYMRARWQQAALAAAGAAAAAAALQIAANAALASVFGALAALALAAAALLALALAVVAAGFASSALAGFNRASADANNRRSAFSSAQTQMLDTCGEALTVACNTKLPPCP